MKQKKKVFNPHGLRAKLGWTMFVSAVVCSFVFLILNACLESLFANRLEHSSFERNQFQRQKESLQKYINAKHISTNNLKQLKKWEKKQPIILLEIYADNQCIYSSLYEVSVSSLILDENLETKHSINLNLMDKPVTAFLYSDFTYQYTMIGKSVSIAVAFFLFTSLFFHVNRRWIRYICHLNEEVQILEGGNLEYVLSEEGNDEITDLARSMNRMRVTFQQQIETEQQLYQANRQLITEMSHDLRTPLTGILLYLEVLRYHRYTSEEQMQNYLEKIDTKARHMKLLSDRLFECSTQESVVKQVQPQRLNTALGFLLGNMIEELNVRGFSVEEEIEWKDYFIQINQEYMHRIIENVISNLDKYAEKKNAIKIEMLYIGRYCGFSVMNYYPAMMPNVESNGIGVENIRNMMRRMNGACNVELADNTYKITLLFPTWKEEKAM